METPGILLARSFPGRCQFRPPVFHDQNACSSAGFHGPVLTSVSRIARQNDHSMSWQIAGALATSGRAPHPSRPCKSTKSRLNNPVPLTGPPLTSPSDLAFPVHVGTVRSARRPQRHSIYRRGHIFLKAAATIRRHFREWTGWQSMGKDAAIAPPRWVGGWTLVARIDENRKNAGIARRRHWSGHRRPGDEGRECLVRTERFGT